MFKLLEGETNQETFDTVVTALRKQGKPSFEKGACCYRSGDCKCAVGHLFPQDAPEEAFQHSGNIQSLINNNIIEQTKNFNFLLSLQQAHDNPRLDSLKKVSDLQWQHGCSVALKKVADKFELDGKLAECWHLSLETHADAPVSY